PDPIVVRGDAKNLLQGVSGHVYGVAFSPKGGHVATTSFGLVQIWELPGGRLVRRFDQAGSACLCVAISSDGRRLLAGTGELARDKNGVATPAGGAVRVYEMK